MKYDAKMSEGTASVSPASPTRSTGWPELSRENSPASCTSAAGARSERYKGSADGKPTFQIQQRLRVFQLPLYTLCTSPHSLG
jgi:hypothetical protein